MSRPTLEVADILRAHGSRFLDRYRSNFSFQQCLPGRSKLPHRRARLPCRCLHALRTRVRLVHWVDGDDLFLDSGPSYMVAQHVAARERLPFSEQTFRQRLAERGILLTVDQKRETLKVRRVIEGEQRQVLHLRARDLCSDGTPAAMSGLSGV